MADIDFLTRAAAKVQLSQQLDLYVDSTGAVVDAKLDIDLELSRNEIWSGIKQYDIYSSSKIFDYTNKIAGTRSEGLLRGYCLSLLRYFAYLNSQQATIPQTVKDEAERVRTLLQTGKILLPDIPLLKSIGETPDGIIQRYGNDVRFNDTTMRDY